MPELTTSLEDRGDRVRFVVATADPVARDRLPHLGYLAIGDGRFATRWFPATARPARHFGHFSASIAAMVRQSARLVAVPWVDALLEFLGRVEGSGLDWWLYGSAALAVRGLAVNPGDIDVRVDDAALDDPSAPHEQGCSWRTGSRPSPGPGTGSASRRSTRRCASASAAG